MGTLSTTMWDYAASNPRDQTYLFTNGPEGEGCLVFLVIFN